MFQWTKPRALAISTALMVAFPLFILMAKIPESSPWNQSLIIALALLQGCLMVFWTNNFMLIL